MNNNNNNIINFLPCPKCSANGDKIQKERILWFDCPACGFKCLMKHYRAQFKKPVDPLTFEQSLFPCYGIYKGNNTWLVRHINYNPDKVLWFNN